MIIQRLSHSSYGARWKREAFASKVISHVISFSEKVFIYAYVRVRVYIYVKCVCVLVALDCGHSLQYL